MTLADLERTLIGRCSDLMLALETPMSVAVVGTGSPPAGPNPDLAGPIAWAFVIRGLIPLSGLDVADADLAGLSAAKVLEIADFAEYRLLRNLVNRWTEERVQVGANSIYLGDTGNRLERRLNAIAAELRATYGYGLQALTAGRIARVVSRERRGWGEFGRVDASCGPVAWDEEWCE